MKVFDSELYDGGLMRDGILFSLAYFITLLFTLDFEVSSLWILLLYVACATLSVCWTVHCYKLQLPTDTLIGPLYLLVGLCYAFFLPISIETPSHFSVILGDGQFFSRLLYLPVYTICSGFLSITAAVYVARVFAIFFAAAIVWFSVQTIPYGETFLAIICFLPSSIFSVVSGSSIGTSLMLSVLFIALVIRVSYTKAFYVMTIRYRIALAASAFLMVLSDLACLAFLALLFMIPARCYGDRKNRFSFVGTMIIITLLIIGYRMYTTSNYDTSVFSKSAVFTGQILARPFYFVLTLVRTFFTNGGRYLLNLVVPSPGLLASLPWPFILTFIVGFVYTIYFDAGLSPKRFYVIRCTLISTALFTLVIATKGYLFSPEFSSGLISGFIGTEFLPVALPAGFLLKRLFKHPSAAQKNLTFAVLICVLANIASALFLA